MPQPAGWDLLELKRRFATASHELIARRMLECRPAVIVTIFDQGRIAFRRGNLPGRVPPLSPAERACWQGVHEENRPLQTTPARARCKAGRCTKTVGNGNSTDRNAGNRRGFFLTPKCTIACRQREG